MEEFAADAAVEPDAALVIHDDIHAIWLDPANPDHVLIGGDGGLGVSYELAGSLSPTPTDAGLSALLEHHAAALGHRLARVHCRHEALLYVHDEQLATGAIEQH